MKYFTANHPNRTKQEFSEEVPDYVLNEETNELERLPVDKNVQAYIQSYVDSCLDRTFEKFLPKNEEVDPSQAYKESVEDLASIGELINLAEDYREEFGLSDNASISDIYAELDKRSQGLKTQLSEYQKKMNKGGEEVGKNET